MPQSYQREEDILLIVLNPEIKTSDAVMKMTGENSSEGSEITADDVKNLVKKKDDIEEQIKAYYDVLEDVSYFCLHFPWINYERS